MNIFFFIRLFFITFFLLISGCGYNLLISLDKDSSYYLDKIELCYKDQYLHIKNLHSVYPLVLTVIDKKNGGELHQAKEELDSKLNATTNTHSILKLIPYFSNYQNKMIEFKKYFNFLFQSSDQNIHKKINSAEKTKIEYYLNQIIISESTCRVHKINYNKKTASYNATLSKKHLSLTKKIFNRFTEKPLINNIDFDKKRSIYDLGY